MKFVAVAVLALTFASPAFAQTKLTLGAGDATATRLVQTPNISLDGKFALGAVLDDSLAFVRWPVDRKGELTLLYTLEVLMEGDKLENGKVFTKVTAAYVLDCAKKTGRSLGAGYYDDKGLLVDKDLAGAETVAIKDGTLVADLFKIACGLQKVEDKDIFANRAVVEDDAADFFEAEFGAENEAIDKALGDLKKLAPPPAKK